MLYIQTNSMVNVCECKWPPFLALYRITEQLLLRFFGKSLETRYCSGISCTVLSSPVSYRLFPGFFPNFLKWRDQKTLVSSRYRQFGKWIPLSSCLVSFKTSSGTQTSTRDCNKSEDTHYQKLWTSLERWEKQALRATKEYWSHIWTILVKSNF